jgi:hypothetical protein
MNVFEHSTTKFFEIVDSQVKLLNFIFLPVVLILFGLTFKSIFYIWGIP